MTITVGAECFFSANNHKAHPGPCGAVKDLHSRGIKRAEARQLIRLAEETGYAYANVECEIVEIVCDKLVPSFWDMAA